MFLYGWWLTLTNHHRWACHGAGNRRGRSAMWAFSWSRHPALVPLRGSDQEWPMLGGWESPASTSYVRVRVSRWRSWRETGGGLWWFEEWSTSGLPLVNEWLVEANNGWWLNDGWYFQHWMGKLPLDPETPLDQGAPRLVAETLAIVAKIDWFAGESLWQMYNLCPGSSQLFLKVDPSNE